MNSERKLEKQAQLIKEACQLHVIQLDNLIGSQVKQELTWLIIMPVK